MSFLNPEKSKDLLLHWAVMLSLLVVLLLLFFRVFLPGKTNHGITYKVPSLEGLSLDDSKKLLEERNLTYEVHDSTWRLNTAAMTVINQHPIAGAKVKEHRKIYLTVASAIPPQIKMPNLFDASLRGAEMKLKSFGLILENVRYIHYETPTVVQQLSGKKTLKPGTLVPMGTKVTLVVGDGKKRFRSSEQEENDQ